MHSDQAYVPAHPAQSRFLTVRGLRHHVLVWGDMGLASPAQPLLVMVHGWMDVGASFQFLVDALRRQDGWSDRPIVAIDWRGFGLTEAPGADSYFFADYLGDLECLLDELAPGQCVDLLGHSMGGNVVMLYGGVRPQRIRRLVNLEGFGMPATQPEDAPARYIKWFEDIKAPHQLKDYATLADVAARLQANNPRLRPAFALWLARHWARQEGGRWVINADAGHKRSQPILYRVEEVQALIGRIDCPVLFVEGAQTLYFMFFNGKFTRDEFLARVRHIPDFRMVTLADAGHMLHHDQPEALAVELATFLKPSAAENTRA